MKPCALKLFVDDGSRAETLAIARSSERLHSVVRQLWDHQTFSDMSCEEFDQYLMARSLFREESYREAADHLRWPQPAQAESFNLLGLALELCGDFDAAREAYGRALEVRPDSWTAQTNLRRVYELQTFGCSRLPHFF